MNLSSVDGLSPTESLILELLGAKYILGERTVSVSRTFAKQVRSLARLGYVMQFQSVAPNPFRVMLSEEAVKQFMSDELGCAETAPLEHYLAG
jgi:hypothetical protein